MAVLPTPGSPTSTGLFLVRRDSTCIMRSVSRSRPMTGSSFLSRASWVKLRPNWSSTSEPDGRLAAGAGAGAGLLAALGRLAGGARVARQQLDDLLAHPGQVGAELDEHLGGDALALADEAQQDVLGADVVVAELQRLAQRQLEDLLGAGREGDVAGRRRSALADDLLDLLAHGLERDAERLERLRGDALTLVDEPEQDVLGADVVVVEEASLLLSQHDHPTGSVGEAFEHVAASQKWCGASVTPGDDNEFPGCRDALGDAASPRRRAPDSAGTRHPWTAPARLPHGVMRRRVRVSSTPWLEPTPWQCCRRWQATWRGSRAPARGCEHRGPDADRDRHPPDRRRRQAGAARLRHRRGRHGAASTTRRRRRSPSPAASRSSWSTWARSTTTTSWTRPWCGAPSTASTPGGATSGPSSPATSSWPGPRSWPRRSGSRSPGCWPTPSAGCARASSWSCSTRSTSTAPRSCTCARSTARPRRCWRRAAASAASSAELPRDQIDALTAFGHSYGMAFQIVDDVLDLVVHRGRDGQARRPRHRGGRLHPARAADPRRAPRHGAARAARRARGRRSRATALRPSCATATASTGRSPGRTSTRPRAGRRWRCCRTAPASIGLSAAADYLLDSVEAAAAV